MVTMGVLSGAPFFSLTAAEPHLRHGSLTDAASGHLVHFYHAAQAYPQVEVSNRPRGLLRRLRAGP